MPASKSARVSVRKRMQKRPLKTRAATYVARARQAINAGASPQETEALVRQAVRHLDRAVNRGAIHPNNAARRKARLMRLLNTAKTASSS